MPLTKLGKTLKKTFEREYGKKVGDRVFYGYANKHPKAHLEYKKRD